ncbi:CAP domain-containing protein [Prosthecobacter sp.]|uniref:CAP domain-containing protein n=1 Tax=Prosthecobacter sp. TaxID=1965333 RepID=UPI002ABACD4D|nr:CAP domain-containing protein [Prosthecobacter sp.]MDZ4403809.1 CAP domain-containing protein [Prosthecobacter sp.]
MLCAASASTAFSTLRWRQCCGYVLGSMLLLLAPGNVHGADPTAEQQYWLELTNRFRSDPQAELEKLVNFSAPGVWGLPKSDDSGIAYALNFFGTSATDLVTQFSSLVAAPPVAWNSALNVSTTTYSNLMVSNDQQTHTLDGLALDQRIQNGGYSTNWLEVGENLFASTQTITHGHGGFVIDWGDGNGASPGFGNGIQSPAGHRNVLVDSAFKEIGIGFQSIAIPGSNVAAIGPYVVTQHFATQFRFDGASYFSDAILTGSVYQDTIAADAFYTPGEGLAGVAVNVYNDTTGILVASGFSNNAGGFNVSLAGLTDGVVYRVEAPDTALPAQTFSLTAHTEDYGAPVIFYDNVYSSFMMVPEPGSLLLCLGAGLLMLRTRSRRPLC